MDLRTHSISVQLNFEHIRHHTDVGVCLTHVAEHLRCASNLVISDDFEISSSDSDAFKLMNDDISDRLRLAYEVPPLQVDVAKFCNAVLEMTQVYPALKSEKINFHRARSSMIYLHKSLFKMVKTFILNKQNYLHHEVYVRSFISVLKFINTEREYKDTFYDFVRYILAPTGSREHLPRSLLKKLQQLVQPVLLENYKKEKRQNLKTKIFAIYEEIEVAKMNLVYENMAKSMKENWNKPVNIN